SPVVAVGQAPAEPSENGERVKASPLARKVAMERGIDLHGIKPTGPSGRIVERDLSLNVPAAACASQPDVDIPLSNLRQTIARRLVQSKQQLPHWYCFSE